MRCAVARGGRTVVLAALGGAVAFLLVAPAPQASAEGCDRVSIKGAGPSAWKLEDDAAAFEEGALFSRPLDAFRTDALDTDAEIAIDGSGYSTNGSNVCRRENRGQEWSYAADTIGSVSVTPKFYADPKRPFGRAYYSIRNTSVAPVQVDIRFAGNLGSDSDTEVDVTSSGDEAATAADAWATSCEDQDGDGCADAAGEQVRDPELAHNWERDGGGPEDADVVVFADGGDSISVTFNDVVIDPGETIGAMEIVTMGLRIGSVRSAADRVSADPGDAGVFRGLSKVERQRLVNW